MVDPSHYLLLMLCMKPPGKRVDFEHIREKLSRDLNISDPHQIARILDRMSQLGWLDVENGWYCATQKARDDFSQMLPEIQSQLERVNKPWLMVYKAKQYYPIVADAVLDFCRDRYVGFYVLFTQRRFFRRDFKGRKIILRSWDDLRFFLDMHYIDVIPCVHRIGMDRPDWLVVDIDPGLDLTLDHAKQVARETYDIFRELNLNPALKYSGSRGFQIWSLIQDFPFPQDYTPFKLRSQRSRKRNYFSLFSDFVRAIQMELEEELPGLTSSDISLAELRRDKVLLDPSSMKPLGLVRAPYSIDSKEDVVIKGPDGIRILPIGELFSQLSSNSALERIGNYEILQLNGDYSAPSFDPISLKVSFKPLRSIIRHPIHEPVYRIELESGRKVTVTRGHSLFVFRDGGIKSLPADEISPGSYVAVPARIPNGESCLYLEMIPQLMKLDPRETRNIYIRGFGKDSCLFQKLKPYYPSWVIANWKRYGSIPLNSLRGIADLGNNHGLRIAARGSRNSIPALLEIDSDFCRLIGMYLAEGNLTERIENRAKYRITISLGKHESKLRSWIIQVIRSKFGVPIQVRNPHPTASQISLNNKPLYLLFRTLGLGSKANQNHIPSLIFSLPDDLKLEFLKGLIMGDGCLHRNGSTTQLTIATVSRNLANELAILLSQLGILACLGEQISGQRILAGGRIKPSLAYTVRITNPDDIGRLFPGMKSSGKQPPLKDLIPIPEHWKLIQRLKLKSRISKQDAIKLAQRFGDIWMQKLIDSDICLLKVKAVLEQAPSDGYAYDLSVSDNENFIGGWGGIFLHNSVHSKTGLISMPLDIDEMEEFSPDRASPELVAQRYLRLGNEFKLKPSDPAKLIQLVLDLQSRFKE